MNISRQRNYVSIKKKDISFLIKNGIKIFTDFGIFFLSRSDEDIDVHYAVLIKKNVDKAVRRNYFKRIVGEYIRNNINKFGDYNKIIFLFNKRCKKKYQILKNEFDSKLNIK